jgi:ribonuclease R
VQNFGFFATVDGIGGDGLVPVSSLGSDYFRYEEESRRLVGERTGEEYRPGMKLKLRLAEANPISGALRFELPEGGSFAPRRGRSDGASGKPGFKPNKRGRPANIKHKGKRR